MRIGELAGRTGVAPRLLRYYEEQGLLKPERSANGYREYGEPLVERVRQIRSLLASGLSTRTIRTVLPCLADGQFHVRDAAPETLAALEHEYRQLVERAECLSRSRDAVGAYLGAVRSLRAAGR
ncbi:MULTISPECIES: MerR family transcriptional regulator [Kitasatospora]|uniref:DNA-binding transcriptional MerR regulator n=1 Tax=Kitasatospora cineracea TaxID=88074 RepID=A0A3N4RQZ3_9ACTN|nr:MULTISPECIES: MerR family transcriptional regulator [Kitasatospora]RPE33311.1 DNA-binding transcriptional MerR regulator [Kitasatospora cineracea]WAL73227.1 MerR family transcriptional regulator [Kitasatospora sp. YST-16]WNW39281.1 MerR family transcriptional regulator [Streptomyces sp. Li-HN-5-13]